MNEYFKHFIIQFLTCKTLSHVQKQNSATMLCYKELNNGKKKHFPTENSSTSKADKAISMAIPLLSVLKNLLLACCRYVVVDGFDELLCPFIHLLPLVVFTLRIVRMFNPNELNQKFIFLFINNFTCYHPKLISLVPPISGQPPPQIMILFKIVLSSFLELSLTIILILF